MHEQMLLRWRYPSHERVRPKPHDCIARSNPEVCAATPHRRQGLRGGKDAIMLSPPDDATPSPAHRSVARHAQVLPPPLDRAPAPHRRSIHSPARVVVDVPGAARRRPPIHAALAHARRSGRICAVQRRAGSSTESYRRCPCPIVHARSAAGRAARAAALKFPERKGLLERTRGRQREQRPELASVS